MLTGGGERPHDEVPGVHEALVSPGRLVRELDLHRVVGVLKDHARNARHAHVCVHHSSYMQTPRKSRVTELDNSVIHVYASTRAVDNNILEIQKNKTCARFTRCGQYRRYDCRMWGVPYLTYDNARDNKHSSHRQKRSPRTFRSVPRADTTRYKHRCGEINNAEDLVPKDWRLLVCDTYMDR